MCGIVTSGAYVCQGANESLLLFDVGGSHIAAGLSGLNGRVSNAPETAPVTKNGNLTEFINTLEMVGKRALHGESVPTGISLAMPDPFDYRRGISYMRHKYEYLYGVELPSKLSAVFCCPPENINFLNDAQAFLIGELDQGAGQHFDRLVGITLGTGVGSAFASGGEIVTVGPGVPMNGEIWNLPYKRGTVENYISAGAIQELFIHRTGISAEVRAIAEWSESSPEARQTFEELGQELGSVLRTTCVAFNPQRIILGGGISRSAALFVPFAEQELQGLDIQVCVSKLGERAALIGAAADWLKKHQYISRCKDAMPSPEK